MKSSKKHKVVLLRTDKIEGSVIVKSIKLMSNIEIGTLAIIHKWMLNTEYWQPHHLYILSEEEIKEGDWILHKLDSIPIKYFKNNRELNENVFEYGYRKIISSTDKSLNLPEPTIEFLQEFVKNPQEEVLV